MYPAISLGSNFKIPSYFLVISITACLALIWIYKRAQSRNIPQKEVLDLSFIVLFFGFLGARIFHILYEAPEYYWESSKRVFEFWKGGFVYFGGAFTGILVGVLFSVYKLKKSSFEIGRYLDLFAPVASFGYMMGRSGCFLAGCCYGKFCDLPWAIHQRHPTQLYAFFWEAMTLIILLFFERKTSTPGKVFSLWFILHGTGRILMETFRDDFRGPVWVLSISSWISLICVAIGIVLWKKSEAFFVNRK